MIPIMSVDNGYQAKMHGLGRNKPLRNLSKKRITMAVREKLRNQYRHKNVTVSCSADFKKGIWTGKCTINENSYPYKITE